MTAPTSHRQMIEVAGTEALWLLEGTQQGRLIHVQRGGTLVRPAVHVFEYGRLIVRAPVQATALEGRIALTYETDEIRTPSGTGWMVTATGLAEHITDPDEAAHYRRTLNGWVHGPHDSLIRIHPQTVTGFRLTHSTAAQAPRHTRQRQGKA